jgi:hypothetical protein
MNQQSKRSESRLPEWVWKYAMGLGLGGVATLYGLVALAVGRTFLPGVHGNGYTVGGTSGQALAGSYVIGGLYLIVRLYLEHRIDSDTGNSLLYALQCLLLAGFIASLIYVLLHVGEVM